MPILLWPIYHMFCAYKRFLIHSQHPLAVQFNNKSPLENHHTSLAQGLFHDDNANILVTLSDSDANAVRNVSTASVHLFVCVSVSRSL